MRKLPYAIALSLLAAACGADDDGALDCAWAANEDNCWRQTARAAASCLPDATAVGLFSADLTMCSFADGATVRFHEPLGGMPVSVQVPLSFTMERGGADCIAYTEDGATTTLTTSHGTVRLQQTGRDTEITCPDGEVVSGPLENLDCDGPGWTKLSSMFSLEFRLSGVSDDDDTGGHELQIFECEAEQGVSVL